MQDEDKLGWFPTRGIKSLDQQYTTLSNNLRYDSEQIEKNVGVRKSPHVTVSHKIAFTLFFRFNFCYYFFISGGVSMLIFMIELFSLIGFEQ